MNLTIMQRICGLLLPAITLALLITLAACGGSTPSDRASTIDGGSTPEASQSDGASTIDWEKVGAYGESCREPLGSIRAQLEVDSTTAELSDAVGEVIDAWESQDNPDALEAYHRAIADFLEELKRVVDSQPRDNAAQETLATLEGAEIGERLDDAYEAAEEAWAKTSPIVRYLLDESESPCFQDMDAPSLGYVGGGAVDYGNWCGPVSCFTVWSKYRDAGKLTLEGGIRNVEPTDSLLPLPECTKNLVVRDGDGTFYVASSCEFSGNIRDGKIPPYEESSTGEFTGVGMVLEYEMPETARDLELLAFALDDAEGYAGAS